MHVCSGKRENVRGRGAQDGDRLLFLKSCFPNAPQKAWTLVENMDDIERATDILLNWTLYEKECGRDFIDESDNCSRKEGGAASSEEIRESFLTIQKTWASEPVCIPISGLAEEHGEDEEPGRTLFSRAHQKRTSDESPVTPEDGDVNAERESARDSGTSCSDLLEFKYNDGSFIVPYLIYILGCKKNTPPRDATTDRTSFLKDITNTLEEIRKEPRPHTHYREQGRLLKKERAELFRKAAAMYQQGRHSYGTATASYYSEEVGQTCSIYNKHPCASRSIKKPSFTCSHC